VYYNQSTDMPTTVAADRDVDCVRYVTRTSITGTRRRTLMEFRRIDCVRPLDSISRAMTSAVLRMRALGGLHRLHWKCR